MLNNHCVKDVSFVDDVTVLIIDDAYGIVDKVVSVTTIAVNTFAGFGMDLNFSAGKSECVFEFVGKGKVRLSSVCMIVVMPSISLSIVLRPSILSVLKFTIMWGRGLAQT